MKGFIKKENLEKIDRITSNFSRIAVYIIIGAIIIGGIAILAVGSNSGSITAKLLFTVIILSLAVAFSAGDARRMRNDDMLIQTLALIGTIANVLWAILWSITIWVDAFNGDYDSNSFLPLINTTMIVTSIAFMGWFGAIIMCIKEHNKQKTIRPLKYTALVLLVLSTIYNVVVILKSITKSPLNDRFVTFFAFVNTIWFFLIVALFCMSRNAERKIEWQKNAENAAAASTTTPKTDEQLRAEIEEKVRAEMIEKEVREKFEKEREDK